MNGIRHGRASCLDDMLSDFKGTIQCDGYGAYGKFAKEHEQVELSGCWAHARRKFHEAIEEKPQTWRAGS